jgi:hypothetical protein
MSTKHTRPTDGSRVVLALSDLFHREGKNRGRTCDICEGRWTVSVDDDESLHAWKDGTAKDSAILDWTGNNVVVECCSARK